MLAELATSQLPGLSNWAHERELTTLTTRMLGAMATRDFKPLGMLMSMAFAPDDVFLTDDHPLRAPGRDCTIRWEQDSAPLIAESHGKLLFPFALPVLPKTLDRAHPTERGEWKTIDGEQIWVAGHELYDDASQVSDGKTTPNPGYNYMGIKTEDPRCMISQMHADGVTPLVAGREITIAAPNGKGQQFFLCQPVIQLVIKTFGRENSNTRSTSIARIDVRADKHGRQMALLFPLLDPPRLTAAPGFLVYGEWRSNTREDGN